MLLGGVLLVAQLGAHEIRSLLSTGKGQMLKDMPLGRRGSTAEFCEVLAKASPLEILKFVK